MWHCYVKLKPFSPSVPSRPYFFFMFSLLYRILHKALSFHKSKTEVVQLSLLIVFRWSKKKAQLHIQAIHNLSLWIVVVGLWMTEFDSHFLGNLPDLVLHCIRLSNWSSLGRVLFNHLFFKRTTVFVF